MAAQIFNAIGKVGVALAIGGATASQALFNGESSESTRDATTLLLTSGNVLSLTLSRLPHLQSTADIVRSSLIALLASNPT